MTIYVTGRHGAYHVRLGTEPVGYARSRLEARKQAVVAQMRVKANTGVMPSILWATDDGHPAQDWLR